MGGGGGNAQKEAEAQERERQARIGASVSRINSVFDNSGREREIGDFLDATRGFYQNDLDRQKSSTDRSLKFAMARSGLTGGSASADANRRVGEDYLRGTLEADRRAQAAAADLRASDEQSRMNLIAMAQSGLDATTGASQAASALRNNLLSGKATSTAQGLGDMFSSFSDIYRRSQEDAARRRGEQYVYNVLYQPGFGQGAR